MQNKNLILSLLIVTIVTFVLSCAGTHGRIKRYEFKTCPDTIVAYIQNITNLHKNEMEFINHTDYTGANRPNYFNVIINDTQYKLHYQRVSARADYTSLSIIEINKKENASFSLFSKEKRKGLKLFENEIYKRLLQMNIPVCPL